MRKVVFTVEGWEIRVLNTILSQQNVTLHGNCRKNVKRHQFLDDKGTLLLTDFLKHFEKSGSSSTVGRRKHKQQATVFTRGTPDHTPLVYEHLREHRLFPSSLFVVLSQFFHGSTAFLRPPLEFLVFRARLTKTIKTVQVRGGVTNSTIARTHVSVRLDCVEFGVKVKLFRRLPRLDCLTFVPASKFIITYVTTLLEIAFDFKKRNAFKMKRQVNNLNLEWPTGLHESLRYTVLQLFWRLIFPRVKTEKCVWGLSKHTTKPIRQREEWVDARLLHIQTVNTSLTWGKGSQASGDTVSYCVFSMRLRRVHRLRTAQPISWRSMIYTVLSRLVTLSSFRGRIRLE